MNEKCDDSCPSNEEILKYVCGDHNLRSDKILEIKKLSKTGEESLTNSGNIEQAVINQNETTSLDRESLNQQHDVSDKDGNPQAVINNTAEDHPPSIVPSQNKLYVILNTNTNLVPDKLYITHHWDSLQKGKDNSNLNSLHHCGNIAIHNNSLQQLEDFSQRAYKTENVYSDQLSLDSNDKLTENTHESSASSHDVNISIEEGDYIENKSPTHSVKDDHDVTSIPLQPHDPHQSIVTHFDKTFLTTTPIEGEYIDYNTAVQQN